MSATQTEHVAVAPTGQGGHRTPTDRLRKVVRSHERERSDVLPAEELLPPRPSLAQRLERGALQPREAAGIAHVLAGSLAYMHERGWVHGELRPEDVEFDRTGRPLLVESDAGAGGDPKDDVRSLGRLLGHMVSPSGEPKGDADLWAICAWACSERPEAGLTAGELAAALSRYLDRSGARRIPPLTVAVAGLIAVLTILFGAVRVFVGVGEEASRGEVAPAVEAGAE